MLRELFPKSHRDYLQSPWANDLEAFGGWFRNTGYSRKCTCRHFSCLKQTLEHVEDVAPAGTFTIAKLQLAFGSSYSNQVAQYHVTQRLYEHFLMANGRLTVPPICDCSATVCAGYWRYLAEMRGIAQQRFNSTTQPPVTFCPAHCSLARDSLISAVG